jgi:adenosine deaminase
MANYHVEQLMMDYLHTVYPNVRISLHAGELAPGMVTPEGLTFHINEAVHLGHAERIGHGIDILHEDHSAELLKEMAQKHIMVEINLTSNDVILGVRGTDHALVAYRAAHVPWALSTDDEGVSRIDLTHEYVKAVTDQNLTYADLKQSARTSLEHAFLHGPSLWSSPDNFTKRVTACAAPIATTSQPTAACQAYLATSEHAAAQWELERRLAAFEASIH